MLTTATLFQLAMQCAPAVHPDTIHDITRTESGLNPYAIAEIVPVKGGRSRVIFQKRNRNFTENILVIL